MTSTTLAIVHTLVAAAWFGAMFYSAFVLHPRARRFFASDRDFEDFIATVSHGARWKVLTALAVTGLTGAALALVGGPGTRSMSWWLLLGAKTVFLLAAFGLFVYVSWRLWPARVLAAPDEIAGFQAAFRRVALTMIALAASAMTLGVVLSRLRSE